MSQLLLMGELQQMMRASALAQYLIASSEQNKRNRLLIQRNYLVVKFRLETAFSRMPSAITRCRWFRDGRNQLEL